MNLETSVLKVINGNGTANFKRAMPRALSNVRNDETCRPIFWGQNQKSYISKTQKWD